MENLINIDGNVQFGHFESPPNNIDFGRYKWHSAMDNPITGLRKRMAPNQFQFIGLTGASLILGAAIVNLKWVSKAFVYAYNPQTLSFEEWSWLNPFALNTQTSSQPLNGVWQFKRGKNLITMSAKNGERRLTIHIPGKVDVDVVVNEQLNYHPLPVCCQAGYNGWVFTNKVTCRDIHGSITWNQKPYTTDELLASVDWSAGFMRRDTFWNWASLSFNHPSGTKIGFNLASGVNETSETENGLWINHQLIKLDRVKFRFDRHDRKAPWHLETSDGHIQLTFKPEGIRKEKINAVLLASNFTQLFGRFNGKIKDNQGQLYVIEDALGFCEDHYAKW